MYVYRYRYDILFYHSALHHTCMFSPTNCCKSSASEMASLSVRCAKSNAFDRTKTSNRIKSTIRVKKLLKSKHSKLKYFELFRTRTKVSLMSRQILLDPLGSDSSASFTIYPVLGRSNICVATEAA